MEAHTEEARADLAKASASTEVSQCKIEAEALPSLCPLKDKAWKIIAAPKIKTFIWKCLSNALHVAELLSHRGMRVDLLCQVCGLEDESINHMLFRCSLARQVWALSGWPHPCHGFSESSLFENIQFLFKSSTNRGIQECLRRAWPWLLWNLWKNMNHLLFEGSSFIGPHIVDKALSDSEEWFLAQQVEDEFVSVEAVPPPSALNRWKPPQDGFVKCNIGCEWSKNSVLTGGAWVLRDSSGVVLCHSRRSFPSFLSKDQALMAVYLWAAESMRSQKINNVIFAGEFKELVGVILRPAAWPSFLHLRDSFCREVEGIVSWKIFLCDKMTNRGASIIAQSVVEHGFTQSYVSVGYPRWLQDIFADESGIL